MLGRLRPRLVVELHRNVLSNLKAQRSEVRPENAALSTQSRGHVVQSQLEVLLRGWVGRSGVADLNLEDVLDRHPREVAASDRVLDTPGELVALARCNVGDEAVAAAGGLWYYQMLCQPGRNILERAYREQVPSCVEELVLRTSPNMIRRVFPTNRCIIPHGLVACKRFCKSRTGQGYGQDVTRRAHYEDTLSARGEMRM